jgi:predicted RNA-binding Zn-ribbon protein involved in translation (DUF1610 family)
MRDTKVIGCGQGNGMTATKIKCPNCGKTEITLTGAFKVYRSWWLGTDGSLPPYYDYEDGDYEPIEGDPTEFHCYSCGHRWTGTEEIDAYLAD